MSPGPCAQSPAASAAPAPQSDVGSLPHPYSGGGREEGLGRSKFDFVKFISEGKLKVN